MATADVRRAADGVLLSTVVALLVVATDIGLGRLGYGLVLPALRHELGGSFALYGALGATHLGGYLAGTIAAPLILRDRGRLPRMTALAHAVVAFSFVGSAVARNPLELGIARLVMGLASGVGIPSAIADVLQRAPVDRRGLASAVAWSGIGIGITVSAPAAAVTVDVHASWRIVMMLCAIPAIGIVLAALQQRLLVASRASAPVWFWTGLLRRRNIFFVAAYGAYGIAYISYSTFAVAAFAGRGIAPVSLSVTWAVFGIAATAGAFGVGRVLDAASRRWAMVIPLATGVAGSLISASSGVEGAVAGAMCVGIGIAAAPAVASAFARERSDAASYVSAFAGVTMIFGVGQIVGPLVSGKVADGAGLEAVPFFTGTVFLLGAACAAVDARMHA